MLLSLEATACATALTIALGSACSIFVTRIGKLSLTELNPLTCAYMPIQYSIDRARRMVFTTWSGQVGYEELRAYLQQLRTDPNFDPSLDQLIDLSHVSVVNLNFNTLCAIRDDDPFSAESRRAVVAPTTVTYGTARMYEVLKGGGFRVFRDTEPARAWLGLESVQGTKGPPKDG